MTIQGAKRLTLPAGAVGANGYTVTVTWDTAGLDLTAVDTISGTRRNKVSGDTIALTGVMTAVTATTFTWAFGSADVATAGDYEVQFTAEIGGEFIRNVASDWVVWEALSADTPAPDTGLVTFLRNNADGTFSYLEAAAFRTAIGVDSSSPTFLFINTKADLPTASSGVITLEDNYTYLFTATVDLTGDRLVAGQNTTILGGSSENCRIKSTGLVGTALITSAYSLPMRSITIEANVALALDANGNANQALDWFGVNFTDCPTVGTIANYNNFIMTDSAFLNSAGLTFNGTVGTIGISQCLFDVSTGGTAITIPNTATVSRRFRASYSSFVVLSGETGISANSAAFPVNESYILDTVSFSGGGTYISGLDNTSNITRFADCSGITNSGNIAQYYMNSNATATTITISGTFYKVAGTTSAGPYVEKFTLTNNRATYAGALTGFYRISAIVTLTSGNNHQIAVRIAKGGATTASSQGITTTSGSGRSENVMITDVVSLLTGEYVEVFVTNNTSTTAVTVTDMNVIIERLN